MDNKYNLIYYLENENIPKFKIIGRDINDVLKDEYELLKFYFMCLDRVEYAFYTETYSYPIFAIYNDRTAGTYSVERKTIITLLEDMLDSKNIIIDNEFFSESIRIKEMLDLYYKKSVKV